MPLYEFRCPVGHDFEKFYRSIGAARSEERCPECGAIAERVISAAGLVFKGSGFYITDYGKDGKKAEREAAAAPAKAEAAAGDAKSADAKSGDATPAKATEKPATTTAAGAPDSKPSVAPKPATAPKKSE